MMSPQLVARLTQTYTALHEGAPPETIYEESFSAPEEPLFDENGPAAHTRATAIQYRKRTRRGTPPYKHVYGEAAMPRIFRDQRGLPVFFAGRTITTTHGIEDRPVAQQEAEHAPTRTPRFLVHLGPLEFITVRWQVDGHVRTATWTFRSEDAPIVAHDEHGDLHVIPARRRPLDMDTMTTTAHANPHIEPGSMMTTSGGFLEDLGRTTTSAVVLATIGAGTNMLADYGLGKASEALAARGARLLAANPQAQPMFAQGLSPYVRGGTKMVVSVLLATGIAQIEARGSMTVAAGMGIGGVMGGILDISREAIRRYYVSRATQMARVPGATNVAQLPAPGGVMPNTAPPATVPASQPRAA